MSVPSLSPCFSCVCSWCFVPVPIQLRTELMQIQQKWMFSDVISQNHQLSVQKSYRNVWLRIWGIGEYCCLAVLLFSVRLWWFAITLAQTFCKILLLVSPPFPGCVWWLRWSEKVYWVLHLWNASGCISLTSQKGTVLFHDLVVFSGTAANSPLHCRNY